MKKATLLLVMALTALTGYAQETDGQGLPAGAPANEEQPTTVQPTAVQSLEFGYLSYDSVITSLPAYAQMQAAMAQLREQYQAEMQRVEDDFNKKYEEFLDGQSMYPKTILQKRQSELQEMLDKNIVFKQESQRMLAEAEQQQLRELRDVVQAAVEQLAAERGYAFILDTDVHAATWVNPAMGVDITEDIKLAVAQP